MQALALSILHVCAGESELQQAWTAACLHTEPSPSTDWLLGEGIDIPQDFYYRMLTHRIFLVSVSLCTDSPTAGPAAPAHLVRRNSPLCMASWFCFCCCCCFVSFRLNLSPSGFLPLASLALCSCSWLSCLSSTQLYGKFHMSLTCPGCRVAWCRP